MKEYSINNEEEKYSDTFQSYTGKLSEKGNTYRNTTNTEATEDPGNTFVSE